MMIRKKQFELLQAESQRKLVKSLAVEASELFPVHAATLGPPGMEKIALLAVDRAANHGFQTEFTIQNYFHAMLYLGSGFDTDPQYKWAHAILERGLRDEVMRSDRLYSAVSNYLRRVGGLEGDLARKALLRLKERFSALLANASTNGLDGQLAAELQQIHPEKCRAIGPDRIQELLREAFETARRLDLQSPAGVKLLAGLMFFLGAGCHEDPQFPWIGEILGKQAPEKDRAPALARAALAHLNLVIELSGAHPPASPAIS